MSTGVPYKRPVKMLEPEEAARHLVRAVVRRPRNCVFPFSMRIGLAVLESHARLAVRLDDADGPGPRP